MADDDQGVDVNKKSQTLTLEEIQVKYYSEGPEAAQTQRYIEVTERPSTSRVEHQDELPQDEDIEAGSVLRMKKGSETASVWSDLNKELSDFSNAIDCRLYQSHITDIEYDKLTPEERKLMRKIERKQITYAKIFNYLMEETDGPRQPCYYDSDDDDDDDFYTRPDDYPESDWHHHLYKFYKKYKPFLLFMKILVQVVMFIGMFAFVIVIYAPLDNVEELERMKNQIQVNSEHA